MTNTAANFRRTARAKTSRTHETVYDHVIVGGGLAGIFATYQLARAGKKVALITDKISWPQDAGSHIVLGLDGNSDVNEDMHPGAKAANDLIRAAIPDLLNAAREENISARASKGYQFVGQNLKEVEHWVDFYCARMGYDKSRFRVVAGADRFQQAGFPAAMETDEIGQINMPALLTGLVDAIKRHGGEVFEGVRCKGRQTKTPDGIIRVQTDKGIFQSRNPVLLATGAQHLGNYAPLQRRMKELGVDYGPIFVVAAQVQLTPEDQKKLMPNGKPMTFIQTSNLDERVSTETGTDVMGGGIDCNGMLTFGWAWCKRAEEIPSRLEGLMSDVFEKLFPGLKGRYLFPNADGTYTDPTGKFDGKRVTFSVGTQLEVHTNQLPLVGSLNDTCDVTAGFGSRTIPQQWAVALAYAKKYTTGDDTDYKTFTNLNLDPQPVTATAEQTTRLKSNSATPARN